MLRLVFLDANYFLTLLRCVIGAGFIDILKIIIVFLVEINFWHNLIPESKKQPGKCLASAAVPFHRIPKPL